LPATNLSDRLATWVDRLDNVQRTITARDLYQGEHWAVARDIADRSGVEVWVASAGYGLVAIDTMIESYQATFAGHQTESVILPSTSRSMDDDRSKWWRGLQDRGSSAGVTISELSSEGPVIVSASRPYLIAMERELHAAALASPGRVMLSTVGDVPSTLRSLNTPGDGSLRTVLGGSMQAVTVHLAAKIVESIDESSLTMDAASELTLALMAQARPLDRFNRRALSDREVTQFIRKAIQTGGPRSGSSLLRELRDAGMACEQSRFRRLYNDARAAA
jgi:hypothetical protein